MIIQDHIIIRKARLTDANTLSVLSIHIWLDTYATLGVSEMIANYVNDELSVTRFESKLSNPKDQLLIAEYDDHIVGFIELVENRPCPGKSDATLEIDKLYIMPKFHNNGIGSMLLQASKQLYLKKGYTSFWLTTWAHNSQAIQFYKNKGFLNAGIVNVKIGAIDSPNLIFISAI